MPRWRVEAIPDADHLYYRVHVALLSSEGELRPGCFRGVDADREAMSVDWDKYRSAEAARQAARVPAENGIVRFVAGQVRGIQPLRVLHEPEDDNRAHSGIRGLPLRGEEKNRVRLELHNSASWAIRPQDDPS